MIPQAGIREGTYSMLIDDDQEKLDIMNEAIKKGNIPALCVWANGMKKAMLLLEEVVPNFIFVDINMPVADGFTCLKETQALFY